MGITPMYYGYGADGSVWFASEMKALEDGCVRFEVFPPGHVFTSDTETCRPWYTPDWYAPGHLGTTPLDLPALRVAFEAAVKRRMMADGGEWINKIHSFTIGLENSPDLKAAQEVADFLGTIHHSYTYTIQEGLDAVSEVIKHLETYDVTTIRASTPMFLMSRKIKAMGIKMVLSGEGADEVFGGYLYFHKAPSAEAFHKETVAKLQALHQYDCLRANKATSAWGLEARVPFLDADFLDLAMNIDTREKMIDAKAKKFEKYIIRKAFDDKEDPYLPEHILWRQKEQFSDGVGYGWIDSLKDLAEQIVTERQMKHAERLFPYNTPQSKEAYMYRSIFQHHFQREVAAQTVPGGPSIACSTPAAIEWDAAFKNAADPSGRAIAGVHVDAYAEAELVAMSSILPRLQDGRAKSPSLGLLPPLVNEAATSSSNNQRSRLKQPHQRSLPPKASSSSTVKFPALGKPQQLSALPRCNQEEDEQGRLTERDNNHEEDEEDDKRHGLSSSRTSASSRSSLNHTHDVKDKNRDFIKELEEKKRKEKEDRARQERRKQKLHEKMTRKILQDADARQKQAATSPEVDDLTSELLRERRRQSDKSDC
ncbi:hypothetical protein ON010_g17585 [Phytophthora cinnamomi]|nr:hypothetical protein ON010_g17585 [Phytophthora cinnamomi]